MIVLVTGASGFVGRHLVAHLLSCGDRVVAAADQFDDSFPNHENLTKLVVDITNDQAVHQLVGEHMADAVMHLAAIAFVPVAGDNPAKAMAVNVGGTAALLRAVGLHCPRARVLVVSSAEVYGRTAVDGHQLIEDDVLQPVNLYAQSKLLAEQTAAWFATNQSLDILVARPFPHLGPWQSPSFAISGFARRLAIITAGQAEPVLQVGNLSAYRDFTDVRDVVRAYRLAISSLPGGTVFNVCSEKEHQISQLAERLIELSGVEVKLVVDPARLRPIDLPRLCGSNARLRSGTGWSIDIPIDQTLGDVLSHWKDRIHA